MNNWLVIVKRRGDPQRKRVFVEDIRYVDEAKRLAMLKLGVDSPDVEIHAELVDERVSIENPKDNLKEVYEQTVAALDESQGKLQSAQALASSYLRRAERAELERDILKQDSIRALNNLRVIHHTLDKVQKDLEGKGENADNQGRPEEATHDSRDPS